MRDHLITEPATVAYIACDLSDDETLADYRRRLAVTPRRWWRRDARY
jgi:hypothetical protein